MATKLDRKRIEKLLWLHTAKAARRKIGAVGCEVYDRGHWIAIKVLSQDQIIARLPEGIRASLGIRPTVPAPV